MPLQLLKRRRVCNLLQLLLLLLNRGFVPMRSLVGTGVLVRHEDGILHACFLLFQQIGRVDYVLLGEEAVTSDDVAFQLTFLD